MNTNEYSTLLSPIDLGTVTLPNRVVMGSMHTRLDLLADAPQRLAAFYARRARGGAALIVTGGFAPNEEGLMEPDGPIMATEQDAEQYAVIPKAVHAERGKILLQILHAGRYGAHDRIVGASALQSPITRYQPRPLATEEVWRTIEDMVRCARLAKLAGFDGVEIMGSEGYLLNQFLALRTNNRTDEWGGTLKDRMRLAVTTTESIRSALGPGSIIVYRASVIDLVEGGLTGAEVREVGCAIERAGADIINSGVGWHESRIPTIANMVPRGAWRFATANMNAAVSIPVIASNRVNTPELAEAILVAGEAQLISMARPMLADPDFVEKARNGRRAELNICIGCNQACLDHIFSNRPATCLVNPVACRETESDYSVKRAVDGKLIAVVGAGPAGLAYAIAAAKAGHRVVVYERDARIGGQLNMARIVPGKSDFDDLLAYFKRQLELANVDLRLETEMTAGVLADAGYDEVVIASGVEPRALTIDGIDHPKVLYYTDVLARRHTVGRSVAIIGAGGIGFDVAEFLSAPATAQGSEVANFLDEWGVDTSLRTPGGLLADGPRLAPGERQIYLLQRKASNVGKNLGVSTGWILRQQLRARGVQTIAGVSYEKIDDDGLHITVDGEIRVLGVDNVIVCGGQLPNRTLHHELNALGVKSTMIGGAAQAVELDALRAIDQGTRLALAT